MAKRYKRNVMKEFRIDEISAVDRPAQPGAKAVIAKRDTIEKRLAMTTMAAGHAHLIVGAIGSAEHLAELRAGKTSFADGHTHDWLMDDAGNIAIGEAQGHSHGIAAMVMKSDVEQVLSDEEELADSADKDVVASEKAAEQIGTSEDHEMTKQNAQAADQTQAAELEALRKRAERAEKLAQLSDTHKVFLKGLSKEDQDRFLFLEESERQAEIAKVEAANRVEYTDMEGQVYRKNDDPRLITLAKRSDEERKKRLEMERKAKEAEVEKLAAELVHLPGEDADRKSLLKSVLELPEKERESMLKSLRAQDKVLAKTAFRSIGTSSGGGDGSPESSLEVIAKVIREKDPRLTEAQAMVKALESPEGLALYAKHISQEA